MVSFPDSIPGETDVVGKRVEPDVGDKLFVERQLDFPKSRRDFGREMQRLPLIFSTAFRNSVWRKSGNHRVCPIIEIMKQPISVLAELEIIILFLSRNSISPHSEPNWPSGATFFVS